MEYLETFKITPFFAVIRKISEKHSKTCTPRHRAQRLRYAFIRRVKEKPRNFGICN